jgi:hypothetical protein
MAHDLIFKKSRRNWARSSAEPSVGDESTPPMTKTGKILLGSMAVATGLGLLFITSPWWRSIPANTRSTHQTLGPHAYHFTKAPSGRIISRPI